MNKKVIRMTESDLRNIVKESVGKIVKESVNNILRESHEQDFLEAKRMLDGKNFFEVKEMVKNDSRFSFGTLNGSEGEGLIDLNYKGVVITIKAVCKVLDSYEKYDEQGGYLGNAMQRPTQL